MVSSQFEDVVNGSMIDKATINLSVPTAKLMHRFYEPLQLLTILNPDRGNGEVDLPANPSSGKGRLLWRRFLDNLSWLCDNKHGGETVSAVAAQSLAAGNTFWLVSKSERSFDHLKWVVSELQAVRENKSEGVVLSTGLVLAEHSIAFSKDKVKNYLRFLGIAYSKAKEESSMRTETEAMDLDECGTHVKPSR